MSKKVTRALVICMLLSLLTGCFPSGVLEQSSEPTTNSNVASDVSTSSEPDTFTIPNDLKNVKFNIELDGDYPSKAPVIRAKGRWFDVEEMKALFIGNETVVEEHPEQVPGEYGGVYILSNGATLSLHRLSLLYFFFTPLDDSEKNAVFLVQNTAVENLRHNYTEYQYLDSELDGFPRSEALDRADELVKKMDIKFLGKPSIYAFTLEDIQSIYGDTTITDKEGNETEVHLTKENEFYLVRYITKYNGIPIPLINNSPLEGNSAYPQVDVIMTKDSLIMFKCSNPIDEIEVVDTTQISCGAESALSNVYDYYSYKDNIMQEQHEFDSLGLSYITYKCDYEKGEYVFKPLWHLSGARHIPSNGGHSYIDQFIDPATGYVYD